jgi:predicted TIM-barrel fold metal-dependent hydrolase
VIVDYIGKSDVTEAPPYPAFQGVPRLAELPSVRVKIGDYQLASKQELPWRDTRPFVALLKERFGVERMMWGTRYPRTARLVKLEDALAYVRGLPCWQGDDLDHVLGETPRKLLGF